MTAVPAEYRPNPGRPWRVSWGFGAFEDFATREDAEAKASELRNDLKGGWADTVNEPWNTFAVAS